MTITLAIGVQRMAAATPSFAGSPAVETLGSVSVICTDKTGTLTRNEMTVETIYHSRATHRGRRARAMPRKGRSCSTAKRSRSSASLAARDAARRHAVQRRGPSPWRR